MLGTALLYATEQTERRSGVRYAHYVRGYKMLYPQINHFIYIRNQVPTLRLAPVYCLELTMIA
jgi:hypothetical protein